MQKLLTNWNLKGLKNASKSNQCFCFIADEMGLCLVLTNNVLKLFHVLTGWATFQVLTSNSQLKGKSWPFGLTDHPLCTYCFLRNATPFVFSTTQFLLKIRASAQTKGVRTLAFRPLAPVSWCVLFQRFFRSSHWQSCLCWAQWRLNKSHWAWRSMTLRVTIIWERTARWATTRQTASCCAYRSSTPTPLKISPSGSQRSDQSVQTHQLFWWARRVICEKMLPKPLQCNSWRWEASQISKAGAKHHRRNGAMTMWRKPSIQQRRWPVKTSTMKTSDECTCQLPAAT